MKASRAICAGILMLALTACGKGGDDAAAGGQQSSSPSASPSQEDLGSSDTLPNPRLPKLKFKVTGSCTSAGGVLKAQGQGFTPSGSYTTRVWYPDGTPYDDLEPTGYASEAGTTPGWSWPCGPYDNVVKGDPPGTYRVVMTDDVTGRRVKTTFTIKEP